MPMYDYRCEQGHEFEVEQRINERPLRKCPQATAFGTCWADLKRLIGRTSFRLNGSGWAKDGYGPSGD